MTFRPTSCNSKRSFSRVIEVCFSRSIKMSNIEPVAYENKWSLFLLDSSTTVSKMGTSSRWEVNRFNEFLINNHKLSCILAHIYIKRDVFLIFCLFLGLVRPWTLKLAILVVFLFLFLFFVSFWYTFAAMYSYIFEFITVYMIARFVHICVQMMEYTYGNVKKTCQLWLYIAVLWIQLYIQPNSKKKRRWTPLIATNWDWVNFTFLLATLVIFLTVLKIHLSSNC